MKNIAGIICFLALAIVLISCSGSETTEKVKLKKGKYSYSLTDSANTSLVEGEIMVDAVVKSDVGEKMYRVAGTYTVTKMTTDTNYTGLPTMNTGEYSAYYNDQTKTININTNPKIADANVFINADVSSSEWKGSWYYSSFRGVNKEGGLFKAKKIK